MAVLLSRVNELNDNETVIKQMQIKIQNCLLTPGAFLSLLCACLVFSSTWTQAEQKNKLVDFKAFGQWESCCMDIAQSGDIQCNLNQVLRYKNHPDFRALIPRFFTDGKHITRMEIDREWQTGFSRGYIQVDQYEPVSLSACGKPCILQGEALSALVDQFTIDKKASIHFHDYLVEEYDVDISLADFGRATNRLTAMQP